MASNPTVVVGQPPVGYVGQPGQAGFQGPPAGNPPPYPQVAAAPYPPTTAAPYPPTTVTPYPVANPPPYTAPGTENTGYQTTPTAYAYPPPTQEMPAYSSGTTDPEVGFVDKDTAGIISFDDKSVRLGFIRKVFGVLALQMAVTFAFICWFIFHEPTKLYVQKHLAVYLAAYVIFIVLYFVLACCTKFTRKYPANVITLGIFTLSLSYLVATISSFHNTNIVLLLFAVTCLVSVAIMLFACQTKYDFTTCGGVLLVCVLSLFFFGLFAAIFVPLGYFRILHIVYSSLGALLFMAFLAFDTQLIMGGRKYELSPEDYVFAALMLYVDIIYIFLYLLSLFGGSSN